jgi:hypothetical protein
MRLDHDAGTVRWEALSHAHIYHAVHTPQRGAAPSLAATLPLWRESVADLGEIRSRYEAAVARLLAASAGANADAAAAASRLVTRGLTDAQELAEQARARRAWLDVRNERLRRTMPEPTAPVEQSSGFLRGGHGWLVPPDFEQADAARINAGEVARDHMRAYERDLVTDTYAGDGVRWREQADRFDPADGPTVQLSGTRTSAATVVDLPQSTSPAPANDDRTDPSFGAGGRVRGTGQDELDFGPRGHAHLDEDLFGGDDEPPGVLGTPPPPRPYVEPPPRSRPDGLFEPDDPGFPPVIGI